MVVRVMTALVRPGEANRFNALIRQQLLVLRAQPGLLYVKLARRFEPDGTQTVLLVEEWRDTEALYAWAGPDISRRRDLPGSDELLADVTIAHYEALDLEGRGATPD